MPGERRPKRRIVPLCAALVGALLGPEGGPAAPSAGAGVSVASDGTTVTVAGYRAGGEEHTSWSATSPRGALICRELIGLTDGMVDADGAGAGLSWPPIDAGRKALWRYWLDCRYADGTAVALGSGGLGFVYADEVVDFDAIARSLAEQYLAETVGPRLGVGLSPPIGLVGVEQWFWVAGYDGAVIEQRHAVVGHDLLLRLTPQSVTWTYGDGTSTTTGPEALRAPGGTGPGAAPAGAARHRYSRRSTVADPKGTYPVSVTVSLAVTYHLDGGAALSVEPAVSTSASTELVVREAQAVVHR